MGSQDLAQYYRVSGICYLVFSIVSFVVSAPFTPCDQLRLPLLALGIVFLLQGLLAWAVAFFLLRFARMPLESFATLSTWQNLMGMLAKRLPYLVRLLNWAVAFVIIALLIIAYGTQPCKTLSLARKVGGYEETAGLFAVIMFPIWLVLFLLGSYLRRVYINDPWFHQPVEPEDPLIVRCFKHFGP
eukprot:GILI01009819.1.p1 GENE.GILI01009819.1~~GILI01009819.1.p1  ORF type:complete len:186 (-),score=5.39 GILI01009819.1:118-675(-)